MITIAIGGRKFATLYPKSIQLKDGSKASSSNHIFHVRITRLKLESRTFAAVIEGSFKRGAERQFLDPGDDYTEPAAN
jgi:hypothetical protein